MPAIFTHSLLLRPGLAINHNDDSLSCYRSILSSRRRQGVVPTPGTSSRSGNGSSSGTGSSSTTSTMSYRRSSSDSSDEECSILRRKKAHGVLLTRVKRETALFRSGSSRCLPTVYQPHSQHDCFNPNNPKLPMHVQSSTGAMEEEWGYFVDYKYESEVVS